jgi:plastocyanin
MRWCRQSFCAAMCLALLTAPACAGGGTKSGATITIQGHLYTENVTVSPNARVSVNNKDLTTHTVTSDSSGVFDITVGPGGQGAFTAPSAAGSYPYHCNRHPSMHGVLIVH